MNPQQEQQPKIETQLIYKYNSFIANLQSWLDCFENVAPESQVRDVKNSIISYQDKINELKVDKYPHLTELSKQYKTSEIIDKEVDLFLSQKDAGYDNVDQAFRCGSHFGHGIKSQHSYSEQEIELKIESLIKDYDLEDTGMADIFRKLLIT